MIFAGRGFIPNEEGCAWFVTAAGQWEGSGTGLEGHVGNDYCQGEYSKTYLIVIDSYWWNKKNQNA